MGNRFYFKSYGGYMPQVYGVNAVDWEDAKRKAFPDMDDGDILVECPPDAIKRYDTWPYCHYIDFDCCVNHAMLWCGCRVRSDDGLDEYWADRAWYFDDEPEVYLDSEGAPFTDFSF